MKLKVKHLKLQVKFEYQVIFSFKFASYVTQKKKVAHQNLKLFIGPSYNNYLLKKRVKGYLMKRHNWMKNKLVLQREITIKLISQMKWT